MNTLETKVRLGTTIFLSGLCMFVGIVFELGIGRSDHSSPWSYVVCGFLLLAALATYPWAPARCRRLRAGSRGTN